MGGIWSHIFNPKLKGNQAAIGFDQSCSCILYISWNHKTELKKTIKDEQSCVEHVSNYQLLKSTSESCSNYKNEAITGKNDKN